MKINLPTNNFAYYKCISGVLFFLISLFLPIVAFYAYLTGVLVSRAHGLGAWIAMWRAKRLTWMYIFWMFCIIILVSLYGLKFSSLLSLTVVTSILFTFHFLYDEFDLKEESRSFVTMISIATPTVLMALYMLQDFVHIYIRQNLFITVAIIFTTVELIFLKEITWFFIHTKTLSLFILGSFLLSYKVVSVIYLFLLYHYIFWFIYPVYKLHIYKREERNGFIMILLLLIFSSLYFVSTIFSNETNQAINELAMRTFMTGTLIHVLSTAPFGYMFGLKKPSYL